MDKELIKIYIFTFLIFILFLNLFPFLFSNAKNIIDYFKYKTSLIFQKREIKTIDIYNNKANLLIIMDDGWETQFTVGYNYMKTKQIRGSIGIVTNLVGKSRYLNLGQLHKLYDEGWDFLNHTYSHKNLFKLSEKNQINEIINSFNWLKRHSFIRGNNILIYPYGEFNYTTTKIMLDNNIISGRGVSDGFESEIPNNIYNTKVKMVYSNTKTSTIYKWIDKTIKEKLTLLLVFHKLEKVTDKSGMQYSEANFKKTIDYIIKNKEYLNIITYSEWIKQIETIKKIKKIDTILQ